MQPKLTIKIIMLVFLICVLCATPGFSEVHVYDANDQYLGVLFGSGDWLGGHLSVFIPQLGFPVRFSVDGDFDMGGGEYVCVF